MSTQAGPRQPDITAGRLTAEQYRDNFSDLHPPLSKHEALVEADRCYFCYDAPCMDACPTSIDIPQFIRQISTGDLSGSAETILKQNILGGMCARVCPTETLCEQVCVRNDAEHKPVRIGELQRHAVDLLIEQGNHPFERAEATGKSIAVVGAGPAGLACAHRLAMHGHTVMIYEAREKTGGLNEYGIASYKTVENFAQREVDFVLSIGGITVETGKALGRDVTLDTLRDKHDAVFLGMGLAGVNALRTPGEDLEGVLDAVEFIADLRQADDLGKLAIGRKVIVIGGGMTAIDAAIQSKLLGAEDVTIVYRRGKDRMNASEYEQDLAQTNGVRIKHNAMPVTLDAGDGKQVDGVTFEYTSTGADGRLSGTGEHFTLEADMVFKAIGQSFSDAPVSGALDIENGRIKIDDNRATSLSGVWAGGDCVVGGEDLTVAAVEDGKVAAEAINKALSS